MLYSRSFKTSGQHRVILVNQRDDRFPNGNSQITVDRFELEVEVAAQNSVTVTATLTEPTTPTQPSSPTTTSSTSIQVQTTTEFQNTPQNAVRPDSSATKAMLSTTISSIAATTISSLALLLWHEDIVSSNIATSLVAWGLIPNYLCIRAIIR